MNEVKYLNICLSAKTFAGRIGVGYYEQSVENIPDTEKDSDDDNFEIIQVGNMIGKIQCKVSLSNIFKTMAAIFKNHCFSHPNSGLSMALSYSCYQINTDYSGTGQNLDFGLLANLSEWIGR